MKLLDDIIELAADNKEPIGNLLRKCLVLERQLKNEKFRAWLDLELDGYGSGNEDLPSYRVFSCINKGDFHGITVRMSGQPISLHVMTERDRKLLEKVYLHQPAASYEARPGQDSDAALPWNPYLIAKYQTKIYQDGEPALMRAWQEIPGSVLVALLEQVRNRVLRFALDLKESLPEQAASAAIVPAEQVDQSVVNHIYGGNIIIASQAMNTVQVVHQNVALGDDRSLNNALEELGITPEGQSELQKALSHDKVEETKALGEKTKQWLVDITKYAGKEGLKVGFELAKQTAIKWISQRYGIHF
ncbi:hypothetical protein [Bradyrhizobium sp. LMG 9283]|uniref:AbiTii domain-containing protein n=1 Tax=Bradyrhizobium sp. LMG 9283 TaxID=592064 RepID=UPI00388F241C